MSATTSPDLFVRRFAALHADRRTALVVYATAGHPDRARSLALLRGAAAAGADIIEVGIPFSDPLADGPVIQASSQRALALGMTFDGALELLAEAQLSVPVVLFTYLNPLLAAGPNALERGARAGAAGILVTDLPVGADAAL
ncbi:MAG TPA: tryptophan synthase subunit alpha, partial [Gemmatimonadaceae bacterium]|nr:tryptophan synthase subunit alpha [Gemmatimonadaceae bacterium]